DSNRHGTILATAILTPTLNSKVQGQVTFTLTSTEAGVGVTVEASVSNLGPGTSHGFHIHAFGDTSSETGLAMAGHFNPTNANHGCPASLAVPHAFHFGDLGSVVADERGNAVRKWVSRDLAVLDPAQLGFVLGRGVIVHEKDDDCMTQPTGNAGGRFAQGIITFSSIPQGFKESTATTGAYIAVYNSESNIIVTRSKESDPWTLVLNLNTFENKNVRIGLHSLGFNPKHTTASKKECASPLASVHASNSQCKLSLPSSATLPTLPGKSIVLLSNENCVGSPLIASAPIGVKDLATVPDLNSIPSCKLLDLNGSDSVGNDSSLSVVGIAAIVILLVLGAAGLGRYIWNKKKAPYSKLGGGSAPLLSDGTTTKPKWP
ncbi:hypothetical protein HDU99_004232, partial [Rhizoclosmatium hyalinum]